MTSEGAKALKGMLEDARHEAGQMIRLTQDQQGALQMTVDYEKVDDQVINHEG